MDGIKTSQTEWSLTEGKESAGPPAVQYGTEGQAPMAVTQPVKGEITKIDTMQTSQQKLNEHQLPEPQ